MQEENKNQNDINEEQSLEQKKEEPVKSRWFGRGIYGSKDVPIRLLDGLIAAIIAAIVVLTVIFSVKGGYTITFETDGGTEVASQKLRYGELVTEPETPKKPGYELLGWRWGNDLENIWNFQTDKVGSELELVADWIPARIPVKFDLAGGSCNGRDSIEPIELTYLEAYGPLPIPEKEGYDFAGWQYSGEMIKDDTVVNMTGEHVLTAVWE